MRSHHDRGSVSLYLVLFAFAVIVLLGFIVDGGQYMNAREQAADIAQQAARAAVDDLVTGDLRQGKFTLAADACLPQGPAAALVSQYASAGASMALPAGCVQETVADCELNPPPGAAADPCVRVTVEVKVNPAIPIGPFGTYTAGVTEQAMLDCGNQIKLTGFC